MCGILGVWDKSLTERSVIDQMLRMMAHRGPDASGIFQHDTCTLGHVRLSIIDLQTGAQPMFNHDRTIAIVYNGEIYNFKELKAELQKKGRTFLTQSDTEVLIQAYEEWGLRYFERLNGIFAFIIYDLPRRKWIIVRDQFGIKPLHYYQKNGLFIAASEQKAILSHPAVQRQISWQSFHDHLNFRYTPGNETLFQGIHRLPPAHYLELDNKGLTIHQYWKMPLEIPVKISESDAIEQFHVYMKQAVQRQLVSDVPLGVYLSGGMDSSTIVQKMHELGVPNIKTFTLGFNEPTDEFPDAKLIADAFQTDHHTLNLSMEPLQTFPETIWYAEEPKINLLQGFNMSQFVKSHVTVALGGLGGDELFAGYDIHRLLYPFSRVSPHIPRWMRRIGEWKSGMIHQLQTRYGSLSMDEYSRALQIAISLGNIEKQYLILRNEWDLDRDSMKMIYHNSFLNQQGKQIGPSHQHFDDFFATAQSLHHLDQVLYTEFNTKMINDYLLVEDRMSMSHSVEERVPFLDMDLVQFGFSLPIHLKMKHGRPKEFFRQAMNGYLPDRIISKKKWGFAVNPYLQFKKDLKETAERILTKKRVEADGLFNYDYIRRILDAEPHPRLRWHYNLIWIMTGLMIWKKMYIDSDWFLSNGHCIEEYYE